MAEFPIIKGEGCVFGLSSSKLAFFGGAAVAKQAVTALANANGTADGTIADVTGSFSQSILNNNFRDVSDKINEIRTALVNYGLL